MPRAHQYPARSVLPAYSRAIDTRAVALEAARKGYRVFPVAPGSKAPMYPRGGHPVWAPEGQQAGLAQATSDLDTITEHWPDGANVGVVAPKGVFVFDVDVPDGDTALAERKATATRRFEKLRDTRAFTFWVRTPSGGYHGYAVRWPEGAALPRTGPYTIDDGELWGELRGNAAAYVVMPPASTPDGSYAVIEGSLPDIADAPVAPPELVQAVRPYRAHGSDGASDVGTLPIGGAGASKDVDGDTERYAAGILEGVHRRLSEVKRGRNNACRDEALNLGRWVGGYQSARLRGLNYDAAFEGLLDAMKANGDHADDPRKAEETIARGLRDGIASSYVLTVKARPSKPPLGPAPRDPSDPGPSPTEAQEGAGGVVDTPTNPTTSKPKQTKHAPLEVVRAPLLTQLSSVDREEVECLDGEGRLMIEKTTIMLGDPGVGKTFLSLSLAANITRGLPVLPLQLSPESRARPAANVLALIGEDGLGDTIRARFEDAGGDPDRFWAVTGVLETSTDAGAAPQERPLDLMHIKEIEAAVKQTQPLLVIIDPLTHFFGVGADANKGTDVRQNLRGVVKLAERYRFALLIVHHMNKGSGKAIYRGVGSIQFAAYARSMVVVAEHDGAPALAQSKANLGPLAPTLTYKINQGRLEWTGRSVVTADQLIANAPTRTQAPTRAAAAQWLAATLADGPVRVDQLRELAEREGIASWRTINAAKADAKVGSRLRHEEDGRRYWEWYLE